MHVDALTGSLDPQKSTTLPPALKPLSEFERIASLATHSLYPDGVLIRWNHLFTANVGKSIWNVLLIKEGATLKYRLENCNNNSCHEGAVPTNGRYPLDVNIAAFLTKLEPVLEDEDQLSFSTALNEWELPGVLEGQKFKVRLLRGSKGFVWQKQDTFHNTRTYLDFKTLIVRSSQAVSKLFSGAPETTQRCLKSFICTNFCETPFSQFPKDFFYRSERVESTTPYELGVFSDGRITLNLKLFSFEEDLSKWPLKVLFFQNPPTIKFLTKECSLTLPSLYTISVQRISMFEYAFEFIPKNPAIRGVSRSVGLATIINHGFWSTTTKQVENPGFDEDSTTTESDFCSYGYPFDVVFPKNSFQNLPDTHLTCIHLEPRCVPSGLDHTVPITLFRGGITLATYRGSAGNHALAIVEVLNDGTLAKYGKVTQSIGELVRLFFHFTGSSIEMKVSSNIEFETRSTIWLRDVEIIKQMLDEVLKAKAGPPIPFNRRGSDALGSVGDSCFTWLRGILVIANIHLGTSILRAIATPATNWTQPKSYYDDKPQNELM